jgi:hypothetical protein
MAMLRLRQMLVYGRMRAGCSTKMVAARMRVQEKDVVAWEQGVWLPPLLRPAWGAAVGCPDPKSTIHHCACPRGCGASLDGLAWLNTLRPMVGTRPDLDVFDEHTREREQCLDRHRRPVMYREVHHRVFRFWPVFQEAENLAFDKELERAGNAYATAASTVEPIRLGSRSFLLEKAMDAYRQDPGAAWRATQLAMKYLTEDGPEITEALKARLVAHMDTVVVQEPTLEEDHAHQR